MPPHSTCLERGPRRKGASATALSQRSVHHVIARQHQVTSYVAHEAANHLLPAGYSAVALEAAKARGRLYDLGFIHRQRKGSGAGGEEGVCELECWMNYVHAHECFIHA